MKITLDNPQVQSWLYGKTVSAVNNQYDELYVIIEEGGLHNLLHFFYIGDTLHCSVDETGLGASEMMVHLMENFVAKLK